MEARKIGILALQGDFSLHARSLCQLGVEPTLVRLPGELKGLEGLIIPGGESTALLRLAEPIGMLEAIIDFAKRGGSIFGTCAGAILLARTVTGPAQRSLGLIDMVVERNAYGRQLESTETVGVARPALGQTKLAMTFIRAPRISRVGAGVEVLAEYEDQPVLVRQGNMRAATFHPELTDDLCVYRYWLEGVLSA